MRVQDVINNLNSGNYLIEHSVRELSGEIIIVGHLQDKEDGSGHGRYEFAFEDRDEQAFFLEGYTNYLKKIME